MCGRKLVGVDLPEFTLEPVQTSAEEGGDLQTFSNWFDEVTDVPERPYRIPIRGPDGEIICATVMVGKSNPPGFCFKVSDITDEDLQNWKTFCIRGVTIDADSVEKLRELLDTVVVYDNEGNEVRVPRTRLDNASG